MSDASLAGIRWPHQFEPARSPIFVRNELNIAAPPEAVWAWLVRATAWPSYYANSANVKLAGGGEELTLQQQFTWRTFGINLRSVVEELVPGERLAWTARGLGVWAYHAWLLEPTPGGCKVITEETQHGLLARLGSLVLPGRMHRGHQAWLVALAGKAESGPPGSASATRP